MFYSLFGALLFILTLNAHNKLIMNNTISSLFGESANNVGMFISWLVGEIYNTYTIVWICIAAIFLVISQVWELKNKSIANDLLYGL